ncbi:DUF4468 domain-containing protein [Hymenobacter sp. BRD128]|uniref:DUF4468 domain-containing protein n=1 Tax=Hymenobacter sp. BRD128 TaxID=2675878 RepID=UPI0015672374|nr:DUF4468 domain-containing protein [Hymenobacter sp. BRD128]QKG58339.1 DUF4468 domain-containing protein [Hymenobacter sp. BRD128]
MKSYWLLLLLGWLVPVASWAQEAPAVFATAPPARADSLVQALRYQRVEVVAGASADELYARAREWVALTFEDTHQVLQLEDASRHLLLGSGYTQAQGRRPNGTVKSTVPLWFRFRIEARPGRYRVEFTDFGAVRGFQGGNMPRKALRSGCATATLPAPPVRAIASRDKV